MKQTIKNWYRQCSFSEKAYARKIMAEGCECVPPRSLTFFKAFVIRYQLGELLKNASDKKSYVNQRLIIYISVNCPKSQEKKFNSSLLKLKHANLGHAVTLWWPFLF